MRLVMLAAGAAFLLSVGEAVAEQKGELVWRLESYNGVHFYTNDCDEANGAQQAMNYRIDTEPPPAAPGTPFVAFALPQTRVPGTNPLYRFLGPAGERLLSVDPNEGAPLYKQEGIVGYLYPTPAEDRVPVYRLVQLPHMCLGNFGTPYDRLYTTRPAEVNHAHGLCYFNDTPPIAGYAPKTGKASCMPGVFKPNVADTANPNNPTPIYCSYSYDGDEWTFSCKPF
jgi:hypothetical protein